MPLSKELSFIKDYLYFYEKRYEDDFNVKLSVEGAVDDQTIPPLILIHFVENVCKHGVIDNPQKPAEIHIEVHRNSLEVITKNSMNSSEKYMDKGIGTENIKSRLNLLFKDNYKLSYKTEGEQFSSRLIMPL